MERFLTNSQAHKLKLAKHKHKKFILSILRYVGHKTSGERVSIQMQPQKTFKFGTMEFAAKTSKDKPGWSGNGKFPGNFGEKQSRANSNKVHTFGTWRVSAENLRKAHQNSNSPNSQRFRKCKSSSGSPQRETTERNQF